jgi:hypothetical protein
MQVLRRNSASRFAAEEQAARMQRRPAKEIFLVSSL